MRLDRAQHETGDRRQAVWADGDSERGVHCLGVWTEKRAGLGEDAEPTLVHHRPSTRGLIGVYDGMGGAGARLLGRAQDDRPVSNAFVASRLARLTAESWFLQGRDAGRSLNDSLRDAFNAVQVTGPAKMRGTLARELPTTMALIEYGHEPENPEAVRVTARWAGDSRCYLLTPGDGLRQLSRDDSVVTDPLETLLADQPLTNHIGAGIQFRVNERILRGEGKPCVLMCATDGFFGYVPTPAIFEYHLLNMLDSADTLQHWGELLAGWRLRTSADDATLALVAVGFEDIADVRTSFLSRLRQLADRYWKPLQRLGNGPLSEHGRWQQMVEYRVAAWESYRDRYTELMPTGDGSSP